MANTFGVTDIARREMGLDENLNPTSIANEYQKLREQITHNFDRRVFFLLEACLSTIATLFIEDLANPVGLNLVDHPASEKTTVLSMLYDLPIVYRCDNFTPAAFVSHAANRKKEKLAEVDLLPRIRNKCIIIPELAPIFGVRPEDLIQNISVLTRIFDGEGYTSNSGVHGERGYKGEYLFGWIGATTPIPQEIWNTMGKLGSRMLFLTADSRLSQNERVDRAIKNLTSKKPYRQRIAECKNAVCGFMDSLIRDLPKKADIAENCHRPAHIKSIQWNTESEDPNILSMIARIGELTARARSIVKVWKSERYNDSEMGYTQPIIEGVDRIFAILYGLARGHAIVSGRTQLTEDDLPLIVAVALSSMPDDRRQLIDVLINSDHPDKSSNRGEITSTEAVSILKYCKHTTLKLFQKLDKLDIGEFKGNSGPEPSKFILKDCYAWLLNDDFLRFRRIWESEINLGESGEIPF